MLDPDNYWVEIIASNPADQTENVKETDPGVYCMNHTMIRVKDQDVSIKFYTETMVSISAFMICPSLGTGGCIERVHC